MTTGYVIQATTLDEIRNAELLANSIKIKNRNASVALITNIANIELDAFDHIVSYPFSFTQTTRQNDWQLYWASPYDYSIAIDCRCVVMENHDNTWEYLIENHSVCFPSVCKDFRSSVLEDKQYTRYADYKLQKAYSNMFFFNKSDESMRYFKLLDPLSQNWRESQANFVRKHHIDKYFNHDIMHTITASSIDFDVFPLHSNVLSYIDMDITCKDGLLPSDTNWTNVLSVWSVLGRKLKLQNYSINSTLYYHEDSFFTEELASDFRQSRLQLDK